MNKHRREALVYVKVLRATGAYSEHEIIVKLQLRFASHLTHKELVAIMEEGRQ